MELNKFPSNKIPTWSELKPTIDRCGTCLLWDEKDKMCVVGKEPVPTAAWAACCSMHMHNKKHLDHLIHMLRLELDFYNKLDRDTSITRKLIETIKYKIKILEGKKHGKKSI